jgi:hydrogenase expression/formation protein HypE
VEGSIHIHHGDGGKYTNQLINEIFYQTFHTPLKDQGRDSAVLEIPSGKIVYSTDGFVVKPIFFRGGDVGKLAVCGTINDLAVSGAKPRYLSLSMIIEEGFDLKQLQKIVKSMQDTCETQGVQIVTGDTKVVEKGSADGVFITTTGIGSILNDYEEKTIQPGDEVIITGNIGQHGASIALDRYELNVIGDIQSDCASVYPIVRQIKDDLADVKLMKDPTRGGVTSILNEIAHKSKVSIELIEKHIPVSNQVRGVANLLGFDPLYLACEGRIILIVREGKGEKIIKRIRQVAIGKDAVMIGKIIESKQKLVYMKTRIGGRRVLHMLESPMLPRIC